MAVNRLGVGTARQTDKTWAGAAVLALLSRPSTYIFLTTYMCQMLVAASQGMFAPTILHEVSEHRFSPFPVCLSSVGGSPKGPLTRPALPARGLLAGKGQCVRFRGVFLHGAAAVVVAGPFELDARAHVALCAPATTGSPLLRVLDLDCGVPHTGGLLRQFLLRPRVPRIYRPGRLAAAAVVPHQHPLRCLRAGRRHRHPGRRRLRCQHHCPAGTL